MLIEKCDPEDFSPPGEPGAAHYDAKALLAVDIALLVPHLNATFPVAVDGLVPLLQLMPLSGSADYG